MTKPTSNINSVLFIYWQIKALAREGNSLTSLSIQNNLPVRTLSSCSFSQMVASYLQRAAVTLEASFIINPQRAAQRCTKHGLESPTTQFNNQPRRRTHFWLFVSFKITCVLKSVKWRGEGFESFCRNINGNFLNHFWWDIYITLY